MSAPQSGVAPQVRGLDEFNRYMEELKKEWRNQAEVVASFLHKKHIPTYGLLQQAVVRQRLPILMSVVDIYIDETIEVMSTMYILSKIDLKIRSCFNWTKRRRTLKGKDGEEKESVEWVKTGLKKPEEYRKWKRLRGGVVGWLESGKEMLASCRMIFDMFGDIAMVQAWREQSKSSKMGLFGMSPDKAESYQQTIDIQQRESKKEAIQEQKDLTDRLAGNVPEYGMEEELDEDVGRPMFDED